MKSAAAIELISNFGDVKVHWLAGRGCTEVWPRDVDRPFGERLSGAAELRREIDRIAADDPGIADEIRRVSGLEE